MILLARASSSFLPFPRIKVLNSPARLISNFAERWSETDVRFSPDRSLVVQLARGKAISVAKIFASSNVLMKLLFADGASAWRKLPLEDLKASSSCHRSRYKEYMSLAGTVRLVVYQ